VLNGCSVSRENADRVVEEVPVVVEVTTGTCEYEKAYSNGYALTSLATQLTVKTVNDVVKAVPVDGDVERLPSRGGA
jgi:hypothetical protein